MWYNILIKNPFKVDLKIFENIRDSYSGMLDTIKKSPVKLVELNGLWSFQPTIAEEEVKAIMVLNRANFPIYVGRIDNKDFIMDGNHRACAAWKAGEKDILAHYYDFGTLNG